MNKKEFKYKKKVLKIIESHLGNTNPIQVREIMSLLPLTDREIRRVVQHLINEEQHPIGSTTKGPYGFYMIVTFEDFLEAIKNLTNRKKMLGERVEKLHSACKKNGLNFPKVYKQLINGQIIQKKSNSIVIFLK
jgi:hypothetical protein